MSEDRFPELKIEPCVACGEDVYWHRKGDGRLYCGLPNYHYTSEHVCEEMLEWARGMARPERIGGGQ
jgi:hypothetical protein